MTPDQELQAVYEECRIPNWDGYQALPVTRNTLHAAHSFLGRPSGLPEPSVGAEPDLAP